VVVESDLTRDAKVDKLFTEAAADVAPLVAEVAENLTLAEVIAGGEDLGALLAQLIRDISAAVELTVGQKVLLFLGGLGDPDDVIARKVNLFAAVDDVLAPLVDAAVAALLPPGSGVAGGLRTRSYTQRFTGRGASYDVSFSVSK
jgi:hypothetical protein